MRNNLKIAFMRFLLAKENIGPSGFLSCGDSMRIMMKESIASYDFLRNLSPLKENVREPG